jgi:hypothetical protein
MRALRALVAVAVVVSACGGDGPPKVAATVSGVDISSERVEQLTGQWVKSQTAQAAHTGVPGGGALDRKTASQQVLGFVIRSVFLGQMADGMGIQDNPTALEALAPEEVPATEFDSAGWSKADLEQSLRDGRLSKAIAEKVFPKVAVSDVELRQKYDRSAGFFQQTWQSQARVAYFDAPEPARKLKERGVAGDAFDAVARELGARQAGSLGLVTPVTPLPQPVLDVIATLPAGHVSEPVAGGGGFLVATVDSRQDRAPMTFEEARPTLLKVLEDEQRQKLFFDWFGKRLGEAKVKVASHYGKWDSASQLVS